jgi:hypothetical protein
MFGPEAQLELNWSQVTFPVALTVALYSVGRWVGTAVAERMPIDHAKLAYSVARLGGVVFALHLFSFGAGLESLQTIMIIRFFSGALSGFLCRITNAKISSHDALDVCDEEVGFLSHGGVSSVSCFVEVTSGTAKMYATGFTISFLLGGALYGVVNRSEKMKNLTGGEPFTLSPMFFVFVAVVGEAALRFIFWYSSGLEVPKTACKDRTPRNQIMERSDGIGLRRRQLDIDPLDMISPVNTTSSEEFHDPLGNSRHALITPNRPPRGRMNSTDASVKSRARESGLRSRLDSAASTGSEFFDCESFGDLADVIDIDVEEGIAVNAHAIEYGDNSDTDIAFYRDNMCVYDNGSPAFVPQGECEGTIGKRFLQFCGGNERKARQMWLATQRWRKDSNVWRIHTAPHPWFPRIKEAFPHFLHGHSKRGNPISYEKPGQMKLKELFREGCSVDDVVHHYLFVTEFMSNVLASKDELRSLRGDDPHSIIVVMDVNGISVSLLSSDVVKYLKKAGDINTSYYPLSMARVLIVNAPFWLAGAWSSVKSLVPESVTVDILSTARTREGMLKYISEDQIPKEYGGTSSYSEGQHPYEIELRELVEKADKGIEFDQQPLVEKHSPGVGDSCSFDYSSQRWISETEGLGHDEWLRTLNSASWKTEISSSAKKQPLRRRAGSSDHQRDRVLSFEKLGDTSSTPKTRNSSSGHGVVLVAVSCMFFVWNAIQGAVECLLCLWILTPAILGGLDYLPSRSGMSLFCAAIVILWLMRTKFARFVSQIPNKAPMRAFRVGVGSEMVLLVLIPLVPNHIVSVARHESVAAMTSTIILLVTLAFASMLGRTSITVLHRIACDNYASSPRQRSLISNVYGKARLLSDCQTGKLTSSLHALAETVGIMAVAPLYSWSTFKERPMPFDASCCFFVATFISFVLYVFSFSLHLSIIGEFSVPAATHGSAGSTQTCAIFGDMMAVPVNDIASLFEEANFSFTRDRLNSRSLHGTHSAKERSSK